MKPLLRRPLSVHRTLRNAIDLLYEVVGIGTEALARRKAGELLDVIGPLGNGFDLGKARRAVLVAGGMGVAPLVALAEALAKKRAKIDVIIGARTKSHIFCESEFKSLGCDVKVATEDGSKGTRGLATKLLSTMSHEEMAIYACGPNAMLKEVARIAKARRLPCQVSLEEYMACGIGVCLGCPVKVKTGGYKMVCKDGPVFDTKEILW